MTRPPSTLPPAPTPGQLAAFSGVIWVYDLGLHCITAATAAAAALWKAESPAALSARALGPLSTAARARLDDLCRRAAHGPIADTWTFYPHGEPRTVGCTLRTVQGAAEGLALLVEAAPLSDATPDERRLVEALRHDPAQVLLFPADGGPALLLNPAAAACYEPTTTLGALFSDPSIGARVLDAVMLHGAADGEDIVRTRDGLRAAQWRAARGVDPMSGGPMVALTLLEVTAERAAMHRRLTTLSQAIAQAQDAIALTDAEGRFTFMNPAHLAMFGFRHLDDVLGKPWSTLYTPEGVQQFSERVFPLLDGPGAQWCGEAVGVHLDGRPVHQEVSLTVLEDGGLLCATRDTGARRAAEAERLRLEAELAQVQKAEPITQLIGGLAHDLNNLIGAMMALADGMALGQPDATRLQDGAARVERAGAQASRLVRRMVDLIHQGEGAAILCELSGVVRRTELLLRSLLPRSVNLALDVCDTHWLVRIHEDRLIQVLLNLCTNARDALAGTPGTVRVRVGPSSPAVAGRPGRGAFPPGPAVELVVEDTGPGLPAAVLARLFEPFMTTKPAGVGTGIGLSSSAALAEAARGRIEAWDTGAGAAFRLVLPVEAPRACAGLLPLRPGAAWADLVVRLLEREGVVAEDLLHLRHAVGRVAAGGAWGLLVFLVGPDGPPPDGVFTELRGAGYSGPILLVGPPAAFPAPLPPSCTTLAAPFTAASFADAIRAVLPPAPPPDAAAPAR